MSLVIKEKTKDLIPVALIPVVDKKKPKYIYYDATVKKADRVKSMTLDEPIESIPYLDLKHDQRSASFISSISGGGKSTLACRLIKHLRKLRQDPRRPVYIFTSSQLDAADPAYEKLASEQHKEALCQVVPLTSDTFKRVTLDKLHESIVVFDDYENIADKKLASYVMTFLKDCLERTRKLGTDLIIINHMSQNYNKTKSIIFECDTYYLNIQMNRNSAIRFLKTYMDFDKEQIKKITEYEADNNFTFSVFRKSAPSYYIMGSDIKLL